MLDSSLHNQNLEPDYSRYSVIFDEGADSEPPSGLLDIVCFPFANSVSQASTYILSDLRAMQSFSFLITLHFERVTSISCQSIELDLCVVTLRFIINVPPAY